MNLTKKALFIIVFSIIFLENSIIVFADIEDKEDYAHQIIVINSLIAVIIAILVLFQESEDKNFHLKTRISVVLGLACWFLANLTWAIYSIVLDVVPPVPSIGDVLWLSAYGFLGFHLLISFKKFRHRFNKKLIVAGILVGSIFLGFMTYFTLTISSFENMRGISMFIVLLLYPLLASLLLIFSIILQIGLRKDSHHAVPWMFDSLATLAIVVADSWFVIVVITNTVSDIWLSSLFISAHYLIMVAGLIWYSKYLTHKSETSVIHKCYNAIRKKQIFSLIGVSVIALLIFYIIPNPLNISDNSQQHKHESEIGLVYAPTDFEEIVIGALLPISGTLSSVGESGLVTLSIVAEEINTYLSEIQSHYRIKIIAEDTETNPDIALNKLRVLKEKGVNIVIGPSSSASTLKLKDYANENGILLIGFSSTSPSLAIPGDNIFRLIPDDTNQAKVVSKKMWEDGIRVIVPIIRSDVYGKDLFNFTKADFEKLGGVVIEGINYIPPIGQFAASLNRINYVFWGQELITLNSKVKELSSEYPLNEIGVYLIAFDEIVPILSQANSHPILEKVRWYGSEATTKYEKLITNLESSIFANNSRYTAPIYGYGYNETNDEKLQSYLKKYHDSDTEAPLTFDGPYLYDAVWLATLTKIQSNNTQDIKILKRDFVNISELYVGVTGRTILNESGDRLDSNYDFWTIAQSNETLTNRFEWFKIN